MPLGTLLTLGAFLLGATHASAAKHVGDEAEKTATGLPCGATVVRMAQVSPPDFAGERATIHSLLDGFEAFDHGTDWRDAMALAPTARYGLSPLTPPPPTERERWLAALHAQRMLALHGEQLLRVQGLGKSLTEACRAADSFLSEEAAPAVPLDIARLPEGFAAFAKAYADWIAVAPEAEAAYYPAYRRHIAPLAR